MIVSPPAPVVEGSPAGDSPAKINSHAGLAWWVKEAVGPVLIFGALVYLVVISWKRTLDPVVDFGREMYTPWQLSQGRHLYVDIAAFYGPLSQEFNGLMFRMFGASLSTLIGVNIVILAVGTGLLYGILRSVSTRLAATVGGVMFLAMFGCAHVGSVGNFNFITPYSHEATHGFVLSLAAIFSLVRFAITGRMRWAAAVGVFVGLVFLTKPEIFVALLGAVVVGVSLLLFVRRGTMRVWRVVGVMAGCAVVPVAGMFLVLAMQIGAEAALAGTAGAWRFVATSALLHSQFYANSMGLESPGSQIRLIGEMILRFGVILVPAVLLSLLVKSSWRIPKWIPAVVGFGTALLVAWMEGWVWWQWASEILFVAVVVIFLVQAGGVVARLKKMQGDATPILRLTLAAFGLLMLLKMFMHTRFHQYGFVLAGMGTVVLAAALLDWLPAYLEGRGRSGWAIRGAAIFSLGMLVVVSVSVSRDNLASEQSWIGSARDGFFTDERATQFNDMIGYIEKNSSAGQTVTVLPEGIMLNVLTQRRSAIPFVSAIPSDFMMFGEPAILGALEKGRPDFVAIMYRPTKEFGTESFGIDYGLGVRDWVVKEYHPVHLAGVVPFSKDEFGIWLWKRNDLGR